MNAASVDPSGADSYSGSAPAVDLHNITKRFGTVTACDGVDLTLRRGRVHGILGENGAGKSTLMKMLIGLVLPDAGSIYIDGALRQIHSPLEAAALGIGMVHQHFSLVDALTVWENVLVPALIPGVTDEAEARARRLLERVGLTPRIDHTPGALSGGERQRVAVVRALVNRPGLVLADEPTGSLDRATAEDLADLLVELNAEEGTALVTATHSDALAARMGTARVLEDGSLKPGRSDG